MTSVYLSGSLSELDFLLEIDGKLRGHGYRTTASWLREPKVTTDSEEWLKRARAHEDMEDIARADAFVMSNEEETHHGGRHTELGIAITLRKDIHVFGPRSNTFLYLNRVSAWHDWEALLDGLRSGVQLG